MDPFVAFITVFRHSGHCSVTFKSCLKFRLALFNLEVRTGEKHVMSIVTRRVEYLLITFTDLRLAVARRGPRGVYTPEALYQEAKSTCKERHCILLEVDK